MTDKRIKRLEIIANRLDRITTRMQVAGLTGTEQFQKIEQRRKWSLFTLYSYEDGGGYEDVAMFW